MKRKTCFSISLCIIAIVLLNWNCTDSEFIDNSPQTTNDKNFSLQEAKEFFENQMGQYAVTTRAMEQVADKQMSPGDFTPKWEYAISSSKANLVCYDVPIEAGFRYKAMYSEYQNGKAIASIVDVCQKLIIVKNHKTGKLGQYILTLIPDKTCNTQQTRQRCDKFINCADKVGFSGIALYSTLYSTLTVRVNTYRNGVKSKGVFLLDNSTKEKIKERYKLADFQVSSLAFLKKKKVSTRSMGEDDGWDLDGGWIDDVIIMPDNDDDLDWDTGNDEWMEDTRPGGMDYEDPDPEPDPDPDSDSDSFFDDDNHEQTSGLDEHYDLVPSFKIDRKKMAPNQDNKPSVNDPNFPEPESYFVLEIYHRKCGTLLATIDWDDWTGGITLYCSVCRKYVYAFY